MVGYKVPITITNAGFLLLDYLPYFMENVTTKSFGVRLKRTFIGGFGLDSSLVDSDSTQVWWTRTRLEFGGLGLDSSIFKWTRFESQSQMTRTRLESFNEWTRSNTVVMRQ